MGETELDQDENIKTEISMHIVNELYCSFVA